MKKTAKHAGRVPNADEIRLFRDRPGVWLTFAGSAFLMLYAERLRPLGLKPHWVTALAIISEQPGLTQSSLARKLRVNRASAMALAATLEGAGYVARAPMAGRKQTALTITGIGEHKLAAACMAEEALAAQAMAGIGAGDVASFVAMLKRVTDFAAHAAPDADSPECQIG